MLTRELLKTYRACYLASQADVDKEPTNNTGLAVAFILLNDFDRPLSNEEQKDESASNLVDENIFKKQLSALELAVEIDLKNMSNLDSEAQKIVRQLHNDFTPHQKNKDLYITSLDDAIAILDQHRELSNNTPHVLRVFKAILMAYKASDADLTLNTILNLDLPREGEDEFRFFFHCENYPNFEERRKALQRLVESIITIWNEGLDNERLHYFLNIIKGGPCIEGATREPLTQMAQQLQAVSALPMRFRDAMAQFYSQAEDLLHGLGSETVPDNLKKIILAAYNGRECLTYDDPHLKKADPNVFSEASVQTYLNGLGIYASQYITEKSTKELIFPNDIRVVTRLAVIPAIRAFSTSKRKLENWLTDYRKLFLLAREKQNTIDVSEYVELITETNTINTYVFNNVLPLGFALCYDYRELAKALLALPGLDLKQITTEELPLITYLAALPAGKPILTDLLVQDSPLILDIPVEMWCLPTPQGKWAGTSPLFCLAVTDEGKKFLALLFEKNPQLLKEIPVGAWCRPCRQGEYVGPSSMQGEDAGPSSLHLLASTGGQNLLALLFEKNPQLLKEIPVEALCRPCTQGEYAATSLLYLLAKTDEGQKLLALLFEKNPQLLKEIPVAAWCRPHMQDGYAGISPLYWLVMGNDRHKLLALLFEKNPQLLKEIPVEALCRPCTQGEYAGTSPLYLLAKTDEGQKLLALLFEKNPQLLKEIPVEALCRPRTQGVIAGTSLLYWLAKTDDGQKLLALLFEKNPQLLKEIPVAACSRPCTQGEYAGTSPLYWLVMGNDRHKLLALLFEKKPQLLFSALVYYKERRSLLITLLENNPSLIAGITPEIFQRSVGGLAQGKTVKEMLSDGSVEGARILELLAQNPEIKKIIFPEPEVIPQLEAKSEATSGLVSSAGFFSASREEDVFTADKCLDELNKVYSSCKEQSLKKVKEHILRKLPSLITLLSSSELLEFERLVKSPITEINAIAVLKHPSKFKLLGKQSALLQTKDLQKQEETPEYKALLQLIEAEKKPVLRPGTTA